MKSMIEVRGVTKHYKGGFQALKGVDLEINEAEIFALLGPNGAGKTTLISTVCGIINPSSGSISVGGFDIIEQFREARSLIGLVPQELTTEAFETVWNTVSFSRGLFGKKPNPEYIEQVLRDLSLWDKRNNSIMELSGGMKRRVLIAKALSHEPKVLFLDEPTAGVDVELRKDMWSLVAKLRENGVTIILTTHYIEEAEAIADRVGVINQGKIILVEEKETLMKKLGEKQLTVELKDPIDSLPSSFSPLNLEIENNGLHLVYRFNAQEQQTGIATVLKALSDSNINIKDIHTDQSSLEDIFVSLVSNKEAS